MVICQAPVMPVVVWKRLPVSVFWAVTVTPGRGMLPLLTTPCSFPPVTTGTEEAGTCAAGACGAGALVAGAGATGGVAGGGARRARCAGGRGGGDGRWGGRRGRREKPANQKNPRRNCTPNEFSPHLC